MKIQKAVLSLAVNLLLSIYVISFKFLQALVLHCEHMIGLCMYVRE